MEFTDIEKEIIKNALKRHMKEVLEVKNFPSQDFASYNAEIKFEETVNSILKKLEK